jgi:hypothetical protein
MRERSDHYQKFESQTTITGRDRRGKSRSSAAGTTGDSIKHKSHKTQISASMATLGYLPAAPTEIPQHRTHPSVEAELEESLQGDKDLRAVVLNSIREIRMLFEDAEVRAFLEHDPEDQNTTRPVIEVGLSFDDIQQYRSRRSQVQDVVRDSEREGTIVYTRVNRV